LDKLTWEEVEKELINKGVTPEQAEVLHKFTNFRGKPHEIVK
jgi:hypothetical protein